MDIHSETTTFASTRAPTVFVRSLFSGTIAGLAVTATAAAFGRRANRSGAAPINATSHVIWGDHAAGAQDGVSARFTGLGFAINHASAIFWALIFERVIGRNASPSRILASAA